MHLVVFSHKPCWQSATSPSNYTTDGGFPFQMRALSELFDSIRLVVPCSSVESLSGGVSLSGNNLSVAPVFSPMGKGLRRKLSLPFWLISNGGVLIREILRADAVHTPIPGDIGTIGAVLAFVLRKPLFVRYCQNWFMPKSVADRAWKWFIDRIAGGRNLVLATGENSEPPSRRNLNVHWIFATSLTEKELNAFGKVRNRPPKQDVQLIIVCRQERGKGTEVVIESLPIIMKDFPHVTLDVVGDGSALREFQELSLTLGIHERVCFHGYVGHKKVLHLLQQADLFCFPTFSEGFPKSVLEALACGLPVITTRVSVLPQLIGNGCGILIDKATPEALARAVKESLSDAKCYHAMSANAVQTSKQYSLERWAGSIGALLKKSWGVTLRKDV